MNKFIFKYYEFNEVSRIATFHYRFSDGTAYKESISFASSGDYDKALLDKALFLSFVLVGVSYYKTFSSSEVELRCGSLDAWQVKFFEQVYQEGLSQFAFENNLTRNELAHFTITSESIRANPQPYTGNGVVALQSGGKDSLLTAVLLRNKEQSFTSWYASNSENYPQLIDMFGDDVHISRRSIDTDALATARAQGARNGHVPVTYIIASFALVDAILSNKNTILLSIGHEGDEPHGWIGDLPVNHQWSKTWEAEQAFAEYVTRYISPDIYVGSGLRCFSELRIAELFVQNAWQEYGHEFSSCNIANYQQGRDNTELKWCGQCPKCANSFILFAPFLPAEELKSIFDGQDLFAKASLQETFKGLLGIDGVMKPFECVGQTDELQLAYHMAIERGGYSHLPFDVPHSTFDYKYEYEVQSWAKQLVS
jgi:7-cyano-7-deazaguanine synthase in queuosine biosynthesis